ncbi:MAG: hypothetical protein C5B58_07405 [Acidobacteria bacterium]|nr:MAG: hypothetical protein C5B58_07405 [Acidobacteriota bacterium]
MDIAITINAHDLARTLEVTEDEIYEMARTKPLPFAISMASPRRLFIDANDLRAWRAAVEGERL